MNEKFTEKFIAHLDNVIDEFNKLRKESQYDDISDLIMPLKVQFITRTRAVIERIVSRDSAYRKQMEDVLKKGGHEGYLATQLLGIAYSLRNDLEAGYVQSFTELIHGEMFGDFLEMAQHLIEEGYKDPAAVIAGSALEAHLRQLCEKHSIEIEEDTPSGLKPKKADKMNADLVKKSVYEKLNQKNITAWLDLRNKAAHGNYQEYESGQVRLMIDGIRDFITRIPA